MGFKPKRVVKGVVKGARVFTKAAPPACLVAEIIFPPSRAITTPIRAAAKLGKGFL
jgi:hypothetical protein